MTTKLKIPKIRFKEFSGEWEEKKLGEVSEVITKGTTPSYFSQTGIKFIKIECLNNNIIDNSKCLFITDEINNKELKRSILQENDLLFAIAGATIGKCTIVKKENLPSNTNQALSIIRLKNNISHDYVLSILKSVIMRKYILLNISVGAQPNLNLEQMGNFKLNLPQLPEQQRIASFLSSVDEKIDKIKEKKKNLEEYKKGVMQKIFSQEIRFKDENGEEFGEWKERKLGDLGLYISDGNYGEMYPKASEMIDSGIPFIRANNIKNLELVWDDMKYISKDLHSVLKSGHLKTNDILITTRGDIGMLAYVNADFNNSNINAQICLLRVLNKSILSTKYFLYILSSRFCQKQFKELQTGSALKQLPKGNLDKVRILLPTLKEQEKIANFLSGIDEKIEKVSDELEKMEEFKKGLLQGMFV